jgi:hypothetical protein
MACLPPVRALSRARECCSDAAGLVLRVLQVKNVPSRISMKVLTNPCRGSMTFLPRRNDLMPAILGARLGRLPSGAAHGRLGRRQRNETERGAARGPRARRWARTRPRHWADPSATPDAGSEPSPGGPGRRRGGHLRSGSFTGALIGFCLRTTSPSSLRGTGIRLPGRSTRYARRPGDRPR